MTMMQFFAILRARWKLCLGVFASIVVLTVIVTLLLPKKYTAVASVVVDVKPDPVSAVMFNGMINPGFMATQVDIIQSERVALQVVRNLKLADNPTVRKDWQDQTQGNGSIEQWLAQSLSRNMDVKPSRESNVINVSYQAADPRFAAGLANAFVQAYLQVNLELKVDPAKQYSAFFDSQAKDARDALEKAQSALSAFQQAKGIIATDERLDVENSRLNELSSQLVSVQAQAVESGSRETAATGGKGDQMQEVLTNPVVSGLQADLARAEAKLQELSARYGDAHPQVVEAKANIAELRKRIDAETHRITSGVGVSNNINQRRLSELQGSLAAQRAKVLQMKEVRDEGAVLARDVDVAEKAYDQVVQRLNQSNLESQNTQSNVSVLTQAVPPLEPSSPKLILNSALAVFVGVLLAVATALVLELTDRRVRSADDVVQALGLPVLGALLPPKARRSLFRNVSHANQLMQKRLLGQLPAAGKGA